MGFSCFLGDVMPNLTHKCWMLIEAASMDFLTSVVPYDVALDIELEHVLLLELMV